ncbi:MAG TPA: hypothetical protein VK081_01645 [Planctomycetota bacterium]|nr:hypothetical protein [Planctomycetota bacterium]
MSEFRGAPPCTPARAAPPIRSPHALRAAALACCAALAACGGEPAPWQRDHLQAAAILRGRDLDVRGRVTFVRPRSADVGTLQFDVEREGHLDNATLLANERTTAFTDGVPRAIRPDEMCVLDVLAALFAWPGREATREWDGTCARVVMADGATYECTLHAEVAPDPHHRR